MIRSVCGLVLAAGGSSRLGRPKQLLERDGKPLVAGVVEKLQRAGVERILVVLGSAESDVRRALDPYSVELISNPTWSSGLGTSIAAGVASLPASADAVLIALTDQPELDSEHYRQLLRQFANGAEIVATGYPGRAGVPALFPREFFHELSRLSEDQGAQGILERESARVIILRNPAAESDIDVPGDLR